MTIVPIGTLVNWRFLLSSCKANSIAIQFRADTRFAQFRSCLNWAVFTTEFTTFDIILSKLYDSIELCRWNVASSAACGWKVVQCNESDQKKFGIFYVPSTGHCHAILASL